MTLAPKIFFDSTELLPTVRSLLSQSPELAEAPDQLAEQVGVAVHEAEFVLEALTVEGQVLP
jgi:hypothetical protein